MGFNRAMFKETLKFWDLLMGCSNVTLRNAKFPKICHAFYHFAKQKGWLSHIG